MSQNVAHSQVNDVEQSSSERRNLRSQYRSLLSDATTRKNEYLSGNTDLLIEDLERANALYQGVNTTTEGVLDSYFLRLSADIGAQRAHQMRVDSAAFDSLDYIEKVREALYGSTGNADEQQMLGASPNWGGIGDIASQFSRQPPRFSCIYGPLMTEVKARKARVKRQSIDGRANRGAAQEANIETMGESDVKKQENQTTKLVLKIHKILAQVGPINLFELVINPSSFSQSVENIFYVSFLIRDGKAFIDDESGQPMIEACEPPQQDDYLSGLTKKQLIFSLDHSTWREITDVYNIKSSIIPERQSKVGENGMSQISSQVPR
ncbi:hypothetical protein IW140_003567 [Coemansia sp. RSA 1813]|nr:hypothetical protein EV178_003466 [Coemansia sp. RSA 1646]KAJ1769171.1 hypothetical protein LPJ74_004287 [Coemansia sp. RSA 1843]KAJ2089124.1 hypothetical protein IW138_003704 [Coemansia sp. RSA 986]KAJ2215619.1 hypothetical protein EV179_002030 [Coemansia sp. RSA 487]KAJ2568810.1 hypothetical protein IW140_003567 [Coemansia sp. RSA 1813]